MSARLIRSASELQLDVQGALGRVPVDTVLRQGKVVNVHSGEIQRADVAIRNGSIVAVREMFEGQALREIDCERYFVVPGFIEPDLSVTMACDDHTTYSRAALAYGTTSTITHLPASDGLDARTLASLARAPGARRWFVSSEIEALSLDVQAESNVVAGLAMQFAEYCVAAAVTSTFADDLAEWLAATRRNNARATTLAAVRRRLRAGLGSNLEGVCETGGVATLLHDILTGGIDTDRLSFCAAPREGRCDVSSRHLGGLAAIALDIGFAPVTIVQMAAYNTAARFGLEFAVGSISPGRHADLLLLEAINCFPPAVVIFDGIIVANHGTLGRRHYMT